MAQSPEISCDPKDLAALLEKKTGGVMLEGVYEDLPGTYYFALGL